MCAVINYSYFDYFLSVEHHHSELGNVDRYVTERDDLCVMCE
jgi:hypothetical protein